MEQPTLEQVIHTYADMVYRLAYAYLRSAADADDAFQDVFLKYAEKSPAFDSEEHRKAWLLRVTINRCRSHYRTHWRRHLVPLDEASQAAVPPPSDPALEEALNKLPAKYRHVIHLHYFENYTTSEIAELTGQRESTVRAQLTRGRKMREPLLKGECEA